MSRWKRGTVPCASWLVALLATSGLVACGTNEPAGVEVPTQTEVELRRERGLDVLLITVDTLRADALGSYGNPHGLTPWMDRLAAAGVRFANAHAHNVLTLPSHANIFSGLYPQQHGVRDNSGFRFSDELPTLAGILRQQGYRTGAFVSAFPLDSRFGLDRGFDVYEDSFVDATTRPAFLEQERAGVETVALAAEWLSAEDERPFFLWLHLYEPHFPWAPPEPWATRFRDEPYWGDVAVGDAALAPLLEPIFDDRQGSDPLVVLTSDHGEALGEHGEATHGIFAYESVLRVPLILYQPELFGPRVVEAPARHIDLLPTILDVLTLEAPTDTLGRSLLPLAAGRADSDPPTTYFEAISGRLNHGWAPLFGLIAGNHKYIDLPIPELYRLDDDLQEEKNLAAADPELLGQLAALLRPLRDLDQGSAPRPESAETRERLRSLGYLGGGGDAAGTTYTEKDDPKRLIGLDRILREVAGLYAAGDLDGALRRCRDLVKRRPGMRVALLHLAFLEREKGNLEAAIEAQKRAHALNPGEPTALALLATYLAQAGRGAEAVVATEQHAQSAQPFGEVLLVRALAQAQLRRTREALATLTRAREIDSGNALVPVYLGTVYLMAGQRDEARAAYREALAINPGMARAHSSLGIMAAEEGRVDSAVAHWRRAIAADPQEHAKLFAVGAGLWRNGRTSEARPLLELFVAAAPKAVYAREIEQARHLLATSVG